MMTKKKKKRRAKTTFTELKRAAYAHKTLKLDGGGDGGIVRP